MNMLLLLRTQTLPGKLCRVYHEIPFKLNFTNKLEYYTIHTLLITLSVRHKWALH
jgi:hypothetical protein